MLGSSTSRKMVWSQKPDARESPFVFPSKIILKSLSLNYTPRCSIWLWRCRARTAPTMPTSWVTCRAKNVRRLRSWIYTSRTKSPSDTCKDTCDYQAMTTHPFKQPEPVECDCDALDQNADPHNCDPMYMKKKKPSNWIFWTFNALINYELFLHYTLDYSLEIIF